MIDVYHKLIEMAQKPDLTPDEQFALGYAAGKCRWGEWFDTEKKLPQDDQMILAAIWNDFSGEYEFCVCKYGGNSEWVIYKDRVSIYTLRDNPDFWTSIPEVPE